MPKRAADAEDQAFSDETVQKLEEAGKQSDLAEMAAQIAAYKIKKEVYTSRRSLLKETKGFWRVALQNHIQLSMLTASEDDTKALSFLEDVWVERDPEEFRAFSIEFFFASNPFFSNTSLKKAYKYKAPSDAAANKKNEHGISQAAVDFDFERDTEPVTDTINWKDASVDLNKKNPIISNPEDPEDIEEPGSFFNIFTAQNPHGEIESSVVEVFESSIDYFFNRADESLGMHIMGDDEDDEDDDDEDADDSNAEDIDLEKPNKKAKH